jgi:excisionase family DNA binding protein
MSAFDERQPKPLRPAALPLAEAAMYLGVSRWTIQRLRAHGEIVGFHVGAAAMIELDSLDAYVARQAAKDRNDGG